MNTKINIDGENFKVYDFDSLETVIERFSLEKGYIPSQVYFNPGNILDYKIKYKTESIKDIIKNYSLEKLIDDKDKILLKFQALSATELGILWVENYIKINKIDIFAANISKADLKLLSSLNSSLSTQNLVISAYNEYVKKFNLERERLESRVNGLIQLFGQLDKCAEYPIGKFEDTNVAYETKIILKNNETLIELFDNMIVSEKVPFIKLIFNGTTYYKIYEKSKEENLEYFEEWTDEQKKDEDDEEDYSENRITLKFLDEKKGKFIDIIWRGDNTIISEVLNETFDIKLFLDIGRISYEMSEHSNKKIKGLIEIKTLKNFKKYIFNELITNDKLTSSLFFLNDFYKSSYTKRNIYAYFHPNLNTEEIYNINKALSFIIYKRSSSHITVKINKYVTSGDIARFATIFSKIITIYESKSESINKIYKNYFADNELIEAGDDERIKQRKTGLKIKGLVEHDSSLFMAPFYARDICQKKRQPSIIDYDEEDETMKGEFKQNKILNFRDTHYNCEDKEKEGYVFPGLIENTANLRKRNRNNKDVIKLLDEYVKNNPYVPCCFKDNQMTKLTSGYKKYMKTLQEGKDYEYAVKNKDGGYKKAKDKPLGENEEGNAPDNLIFINKDLSRRGVKFSPNSFIHCMEYIFNNTEYTRTKDKEAHVISKRLSFTKNNGLPIVKQEMYNYDIEDIKKYINNVNLFFNPLMFVRFMEYVYNCNIFLYILDKKDNPDGNIILPFHKNEYLVRENKYKNNVMILMNKILDKYQCEILKLRSEYIYPSTSTVTINNREILKLHINQKIVEPNGRIRKLNVQRKSSLLDNVIEQYVDENGKACAFLFEGGILLFTNKCQPLPVKLITEDIYKYKGNSFWEIQKFCKKYDIKIAGTTPDGSALVLENLVSFEECFTLLKDKDEDIEHANYVPMIYKNMPSREKSLLDKYNTNRMIANCLKELALYLCAHNDGILSQDDFKIIKDYKYEEILNEIDNLSFSNPLFTKDKKIIINSSNLIPKILYYIKVQKLNNSGFITLYKSKKIMSKQYYTSDDFVKRDGQVIFVNSENLLFWLSFQEELEKQSYFEVKNTLDSSVKAPYIYYFSKGSFDKYCLVQNVENGEMLKAMYCSSVWEKYKVNIGYNDFYELEQEDVGYFGIINLQDTEEKIRETIKKYEHKIVLKYDNGKYASIMFL